MTSNAPIRQVIRLTAIRPLYCESHGRRGGKIAADETFLYLWPWAFNLSYLRSPVAANVATVTFFSRQNTSRVFPDFCHSAICSFH